MAKKITIGSFEWASMPDIGIPLIRAKVDSGAKSSSLHATNIKIIEKKGKKYVSFKTKPFVERQNLSVKCLAELVTLKSVRSSNGDSELRIFIKTKIKIGEQEFETLVSLSNRSYMESRFLLGRDSFKDWARVTAGKSFVLKDYEDSEIDKIYKIGNSTKNALKIGLLTLSGKLDSSSFQRIKEEAENRGHIIETINISKCYMKVGIDGTELKYRDDLNLDELDVVIPRAGGQNLNFYLATMRQFKSLGVYILHSTEAITAARDKFYTAQILSQKGLPTPSTGMTISPEDTAEVIKSVGSAPFIIKLINSSKGNGVVLAQTFKSAESTVNAFKSIGVQILVQEYFEESKGRDIRCFVIGKKVVAAMERIASSDDEFRSNIHQGGVGRAAKLTELEKTIAINACNAIGLSIAGVDIIRTNKGPVILEVNSAPGLLGIEQATGINIAKQIIEFIETKMKFKSPK